MNEDELRRLFRDALGEPRQRLRPDLVERITARASRPRFAALGPIAATLLIVAVAGFAGWRLVAQRAAIGPVQTPAATQQATPATVQPTAMTIQPPQSAGPQPARIAAAMGYDAATGQVVLFGGTALGASSALADTWTWDRNGWIQRQVSPSPPPRQEAAMAYDPVHQRLLLFGGIDADGTPNTDTWLWDGSRWLEQHPSLSPPPRRDAAIAYDDTLHKIVMFGGWNPVVGGPAKLNDTWTWDGSAWARLQPSTVPAKRGSSVMGYSSRSHKLVMFGGDTGSATGETWIFDGTNWTQLDPSATHPSDREATVMAPDAAGNLIVFGGEAASSPGYYAAQDDTWMWDGAAWVQLHPSPAPPARGGETLAPSMVYDAALGFDVLYGGQGASPAGEVLSDTWTWDGNRWTKVGDNSQSAATAPSADASAAAVHEPNGPAFANCSVTTFRDSSGNPIWLCPNTPVGYRYWHPPADAGGDWTAYAR